jgi:circadian clock protein KaiB
MSTTPQNSRAGSRKRYVLKLYVTGATRRSQRAITNLNSICEEHLKGRYDLEVVDIYQAPLSAKDADILAAPTLIRQLPLPARRLIGDLSEEGRVLMLLDLKAKVKSDG